MPLLAKGVIWVRAIVIGFVWWESGGLWFSRRLEGTESPAVG